MLWLAAYLTGFPPAGLYTLCWTHGLAPIAINVSCIDFCYCYIKVANYRSPCMSRNNPVCCTLAYRKEMVQENLDLAILLVYSSKYLTFSKILATYFTESYGFDCPGRFSSILSSTRSLAPGATQTSLHKM